MRKKRMDLQGANPKTNLEILRILTDELVKSETARIKILEELQLRTELDNIFLTEENYGVFSSVLGLILMKLRSSHGIVGYIDKQGNFIAASISKKAWPECELAKQTCFPKDLWNNLPHWGKMLSLKTICNNSPTDVIENHVPINRILMCPIIHKKTLIGIIAVANKLTNYTESDIETIETISTQLSPILCSWMKRI